MNCNAPLVDKVCVVCVWIAHHACRPHGGWIGTVCHRFYYIYSQLHALASSANPITKNWRQHPLQTGCGHALSQAKELISFAVTVIIYASQYREK